MKKGLFLFVLLLFSTHCFVSAQNDEKYFPTGTTWQEVFIQRGYEEYAFTKTFYVGEDTLINERLYKKIWIDDKTQKIWIREADDKVWLLRNDFQEELLIYDFDWTIGKTIYKQFYKEEIGLRADTIAINTINKSRLEDGQEYEYIEYKASYADVKMIKGIGVTSEPIKDMCILASSEMEFILPMIAEYRLLTFKRNGVVIYKDKALEDFLSIGSVSTNDAVSSESPYDLQGRPADGTQKGIYIRNGKKVLVR